MNVRLSQVEAGKLGGPVGDLSHLRHLIHTLSLWDAVNSVLPYPFTMTDAKAGYVPGVCNIGSREIMRRRTVGIAALVFAVISGYTLLMADEVARSARWAIFFPLLVSAIGFIQARNKFCLAYGLAGTFNFGKISDMERVFDSESKKSDRKKALTILFQALVSAGVLTAIFVYIP